MNRIFGNKKIRAIQDRDILILPQIALLFPLLLLLTVGCINVPRTAGDDQAVSYTEINGYKFHTEVFGDKALSVVIVVHGGPGGDFRYLLPLSALSDQYRVVFYDQRGAGLSPREATQGYTIDRFIKDLDDIVNFYSNNSPVRLIGHSWGGMLVTAYTAQHPEKVTHAVIAEPGMLNKEAAKASVSRLKENESFQDKIKMIPYFAYSLFVKSKDGHEKKDYIMTRILESAKGKPYMCDEEKLPANSFWRAGFSSFETMTMPLMEKPELFDYDLTKGIERYKGRLMLLSSACSFAGYEFQEKYHLPLFPPSIKHLKMQNTGHYMLTNKTEESLHIIREFLKG